MGGLLSRFRTKLSTKEQLEKIDSDIQKIEEYKWSTLRRQKNLLALILLCSGLVYAAVALIFYFYFLPRTTDFYEKLVYTVPLIVFPPLVYLLRKAIQMYYMWVIEIKEENLRELKKEKRNILDRVMETETYKVAKELLEKFDPSALNKDKPDTSPRIPSQINLGSRSDLRYRPIATRNTPITSSPQVINRSQVQMRQVMPQTPSTSSQQMMRAPLGPVAPMRMIMGTPAAPVNARLPRPILPQERSVVDKVVDYVVGDGPSNRYALICMYCHSHNGMALKDEFEYLSFRCCYCYLYNRARKTRPFAPQLHASAAPPVVDEPESDDQTDAKSNQPKGSHVDIVDVSSPAKSISDEETNSGLNNESPKRKEEKGEETREDSEPPVENGIQDEENEKTQTSSSE